MGYWMKKVSEPDRFNLSPAEVVKVACDGVRKVGRLLKYIPEELQNNKKVVLTAVAQSGEALQFAAEKLKMDMEVISVALQQDWGAWHFVADELKSDQEALGPIKHWPSQVQARYESLEDAPPELRSNKGFMMAAVKSHGYCLKYASENLKEDKDLVMAAIMQNGTAFKLAAQKLQNDRTFVLDAVLATRAPWLRQYVSSTLQADSVFQQEVANAAGHGLVFTWYNSPDVFKNMRKDVSATGASVPGGAAYDKVMAELKRADRGRTATVWFEEALVFGATNDAGDWTHPAEDCGRDRIEVPEKKGGLPPGWGEGRIQLSDGSSFPREAPEHDFTKKPLGQGCRWERQVLDKLGLERKGILARLALLLRNLRGRMLAALALVCGASEAARFLPKDFESPQAVEMSRMTFQEQNAWARFKAAATSSGVPGGGAGGAFPLEAELFGVDLGAVLGAGAEAGDGTLDLGTAALLEGGAFPLEASLATGAALTLALAAAFTWGTAGAPAVALLGGAAGAGFGAAFAFALPLAGLQGAAGLPGLAADFGGALAADLGTAPSFALALGLLTDMVSTTSLHKLCKVSIFPIAWAILQRRPWNGMRSCTKNMLLQGAICMRTPTLPLNGQTKTTGSGRFAPKADSDLFQGGRFQDLDIIWLSGIEL
ncbi:Uncharacterized protein SCF082_LOCUS11348 [Durusdinium trenchii]|uniref:DUF4116 domain-containing protein n=1 Tax=Durusdinium trenchii TaxID=1381693 RepID=A0ABP0JCU3_9DINO